MSDQLVWRQLHWPRPLDVTSAVAVMRAWAADQRSPVIVLEARSSAAGIRYLLGCAPSALPSVARRLTTAIPAVQLTEPATERTAIAAAGRLKLSTRHRALRTDNPETAIRQVLGALAQVNRGELLVLQLVLGPRRIPLAVLNQSPSSIVMPWYQVVWRGNGGVVDGEKRAALRDKAGDHGFAATLRIGALAATPERSRSLIVSLFSAIRVSEAPGLQARPAAASQTSRPGPAGGQDRPGDRRRPGTRCQRPARLLRQRRAAPYLGDRAGDLAYHRSPEPLRRDFNYAWFDRLAFSAENGQPVIAEVRRTEWAEALHTAQVLDTDTTQTTRATDERNVFQDILNEETARTGPKEKPGTFRYQVTSRVRGSNFACFGGRYWD